MLFKSFAKAFLSLWVQGVGYDELIMHWIPLIKKIQAAGKSIFVDLKKSEFDEFTKNVDLHGIFFCISESDYDEQQKILEFLLKN